ncbi:MAG: TAT-variant-translocated molybdopterin oxidoreductase [Planctomycetaceae bacterium]
MSLLDQKPNTKQYWRSLDELADKPAFKDWMSREFPSAASELPTNVSRRRWLQLMGASLAFGGISGCRWEAEEFAPFTVRPQNRTPGEKQYFSTMWEVAGVARPLTVTSIDGRPIKIEGNTEHPASRGATSAWDQAMILSMYDPDRTTTLLERVRNELVPRSWDDFDGVLSKRLAVHEKRGGEGLAIVREVTSSPTQLRLMAEIREKFPKATICQVDPARAEYSTAVLGTGTRVSPNFERAKVIACFDADPFGQHPDSVRLVRNWADKRAPDAEWMNRLYCFESDLSLTGSNADHRVPIRSSEIATVLSQIERGLDEQSVKPPAEADSKLERVVAALIDDLKTLPGESILVAGVQQPPSTHATIHRINFKLQNYGSTLELLEIPDVDSLGIGELVKQIQSKEVETLFVLDANPAFGTEQSDQFRTAMARVPFSVHFGAQRDETARLCRWHVPLAHALESWCDGRTFDGTITLGQPMIAPLFEGRSAIECLARILGRTDEPRDLIRETLSLTDSRFRGEKNWRRAIHNGFVDEIVFPKKNDRDLPSVAESSSGLDASSEFEVVVRFSGTTFDGRFANNGWLQETPNAISKLTWDNAAVMSPATARDLNVAHGEMVRVEANGRSIELPIFELPGVARGSVQLELGYGRPAAGHVGGLVDEGVAPVGTDVSVLLPADGSMVLTDVAFTALGTKYDLATTQDHFAIDEVGLEAIGARIGELVRTGTLSEYEHHPDFAQHRGPHHPPLESLWEEQSYDGHAWGMSIDLNRCIGCNACMVACQSENNVPIVGKDQVLGGRAMHGIRMDRYFAGDQEDPEVAHQPVACHHCENAPCEQVCPVAATVHSDEGLNDMVYNRCIGTRYCANNCPYKVRRFNFLDYNAPLEEPEKELVQLVINPEVTVRSRGVMEKCTYCVQRIQDTKITAGNERRSIADGEIQSACQQACPAQAIVFGDLNDPESAVARAHADGRSYGMLSELNTKPRTKYLAKIRNPHPWLEEEKDHGHGEASHGHEKDAHAATRSHDSSPRQGRPQQGDPLLPILGGHNGHA